MVSALHIHPHPLGVSPLLGTSGHWTLGQTSCCPLQCVPRFQLGNSGCCSLAAASLPMAARLWANPLPARGLPAAVSTRARTGILRPVKNVSHIKKNAMSCNCIFAVSTCNFFLLSQHLCCLAEKKKRNLFLLSARVNFFLKIVVSCNTYTCWFRTVPYSNNGAPRLQSTNYSMWSPINWDLANMT